MWFLEPVIELPENLIERTRLKRNLRVQHYFQARSGLGLMSGYDSQLEFPHQSTEW